MSVERRTPNVDFRIVEFGGAFGLIGGFLPEDFGNPWMTNLVQPSAPDAVGLCPPAPGWYVVAVLVVIGLARIGWKGIRRWRANAYRREALRLIDRIGNNESLAELPEIMKRAALSAFPRSEVASLSGEAWLAFLDGTLPTTEFSDGPGRTLADLAFSVDGGEGLSEDERRELVGLAGRWVKKHKGERR